MKQYYPVVIALIITPLFGYAAEEKASLRTIPIVEVMGGIPKLEKEIVERYHDENGDPIPLVFRGAIRDWEAASWTPEYFADKFGDKKIMTLPQKILEDGLEYDEENKKSIDKFIHTTIKDHINDILHNPKQSGYFLAILPYGATEEDLLNGDGFTKNGIFIKDNLDLANQTPFPESIIKPNAKEPRSYALFIGSGNSVTSLHSHGSTFLSQIYGKKIARLIHPRDTKRCYCKRVIRKNFAESCEVDITTPDFEKYPELKDLEVFQTALQAGDVLYIPDGWLHDIRGLGGASISIASGF